jgi:glutathionylspermidine synthase
MVYQKYVELPQIRRMTEGGPRDLHLVASCFVVNGEPGGICVRAGGIITDESAWYLPLCVRR